MRYVIAFIIALAFATPSFAAAGDANVPGSSALNKVEQLEDAHSSETTVLEGKLAVQDAATNMYSLQDNTGSVPVMITSGALENQVFTPADTVRVYGHVEIKDGGDRMITVDRMEVVR